jgi:hypothetical protein
MEVNGQLHFPAASAPERTGYEAGWAPVGLNAVVKRKLHCRESNPSRPASRYTELSRLHEDKCGRKGLAPPFLALALDGGEKSASCPGTHWVGPRAGLDAVSGTEPQPVAMPAPTAAECTHWLTPSTTAQ